MFSLHRISSILVVALVLHDGVFVCCDELETGPPFGEDEGLEECNDDTVVCENGDIIMRDPMFNCDFREECEDTPAPSPGFVTPEPTINENAMFEEDMKDESRCPLDVNECGNIRDPSRDCEFIPCNDEEEDSGGLACTDDVKECSDGTFVPRDPDNNCDFEPCPDNVIPVEDITLSRPPTVTPTDTSDAPTDAIADADEEMMSSGMPTTQSIPETDSTTPTTMPTFEPSTKMTSAPPDMTTSAAAGAFSGSIGSVAIRAASFVFGILLVTMHI